MTYLKIAALLLASNLQIKFDEVFSKETLNCQLMELRIVSSETLKLGKNLTPLVLGKVFLYSSHLI